jgi:hypothetical protein
MNLELNRIGDPTSINGAGGQKSTTNSQVLQSELLQSDSFLDLITTYYTSLCKNMKKAKKYQDMISNNMASDEVYAQSIDKYNQAYLNVINISLGVFIAMGCIYNTLKSV